MVSEIWFKNCRYLNEAIDGLSEGKKIGSIIKNRPGQKRQGGVEIFWDMNKATLM